MKETRIIAVIGIGHGLALIPVEPIEQQSDFGCRIARAACLDPFKVGPIHGDDMREAIEILKLDLARQLAFNGYPVPARNRNCTRIGGVACVISCGARRIDKTVKPVTRGRLTKRAFCHRRAADIAKADKQDCRRVVKPSMHTGLRNVT